MKEKSTCYSHLSQEPHPFCTKECNSFRLSGGFQNKVLRLDFAPKSYPVLIARGFVRWLQHAGETSVNDRKVKGSGLERDLSTVPTGSYNCICVLGRFLTTRCSNYDGNKSPKHGHWVQGYFI
ncbi:hypothetical protein AVEN_200474-1 [Araneus ventricosus]|uniref:Uncharacterized protein n=1 Tax=Araneus ventricosus TaxID=182803 RepID=A0A4Y2ICG3_ARAVE|nr:hypothetical protein AVEN_200474-1 [Araneus ventricosus]